ncbi:penicillin-binding protein 1C [bacterium]|nr:penicillin-binding protein 1C [bacterium]
MKKIQKIDLVFACLLGLLSFFYPISGRDLSFDEVASIKILDRNGYLLREVLSIQQGKGHWTPLAEISSRAVEAAIAAEDKRFYAHGGVDPLALARAFWQNLSSGKIVSGGSTITQQVIRNMFRFPRNIFYKTIEMWYAVRLEHTLSKNKIMEHYFNRIPFGNQTFGIEAASQLYLGKKAKDLTWAEASFLIALPKSPTHYNPYKDVSASKQRQAFILTKLFENKIISKDEWDRARNEPVFLFPKSSPFFAPHFCDHLIQNGYGSGSSIHSTLDLALQTEVEKIIQGHITNLQPENVTNAAVIILNNKTGDVLALAGSSDYFDDRHDGQYNAVFAKRQPGSALKPFTYAAAMNKGLTASTIVPDIETVIPSEKANFTPHNYDNQFHGPVRARIALACSYNVSAVRVLQNIGVESLLSTLHACGVNSLTETPEYYGHGLTLGNGEVTLFELARAYSILANRGQWIEPRFILEQPVHTVRDNIFSPQISFLITDILSDHNARTPAFGYDSPLSLPFPCAAKTGTSSDFKDNMTVGYTADYTVGIWVGNFDNTPMRQISGVTGAGPIFHDIMMHLYKDRNPTMMTVPARVVKKNVCSMSGDLPHIGCRAGIEEFFIEGTEPKTKCSFHQSNGILNYALLSPVYQKWLAQYSGYNLTSSEEKKPSADIQQEQMGIRIIYPKNKAIFKIDPNLKRSYQSIYFEAWAPEQVHEIRWYVNNSYYQAASKPFSVMWNLSPGTYRIRAEGKFNQKTFVDELSFEVLP